jgi:sugar lactone lactonase YvrE
MRRLRTSLLLVAVAALMAPATASALPDCAANQAKAKRIISGRGLLESVIVDGKGRLFFTDAGVKGLVRVDRPGGRQVVLAAGKLEGGGGIVLDADGSLLVGFGDAIPNGLSGKTNPSAGIVRIDPDTGAVTPYATGTQMSNGLARLPEAGGLGRLPAGTIFASNDVLGGIDRVAPGGASVQTDWAPVEFANGLAIDSTGRYLFANQTFRDAQISRVDLADPSRVVVYARPGSEDFTAGLDGMTIDDRDRLFVAANLAGEVWRVDPDRKLCKLANGLGMTSAVALGRGTTGFAAGNLYAVTFGGVVWEVDGVTEPAASPAPIDDVAPKLTALRVAGHRVRFALDERARVVVTIARRVCAKAGCRFVTVRRLAFDAAPGALSVLLAGGHRAKPGRYRVTVGATDPVGNAAKPVVRVATVGHRSYN